MMPSCAPGRGEEARYRRRAGRQRETWPVVVVELPVFELLLLLLLMCRRPVRVVCCGRGNVANGERHAGFPSCTAPVEPGGLQAEAISQSSPDRRLLPPQHVNKPLHLCSSHPDSPTNLHGECTAAALACRPDAGGVAASIGAPAIEQAASVADACAGCGHDGHGRGAAHPGGRLRGRPGREPGRRARLAQRARPKRRAHKGARPTRGHGGGFEVDHPGLLMQC